MTIAIATDEPGWSFFAGALAEEGLHLVRCAVAEAGDVDDAFVEGGEGWRALEGLSLGVSEGADFLASDGDGLEGLVVVLSSILGGEEEEVEVGFDEVAVGGGALWAGLGFGEGFCAFDMGLCSLTELFLGLVVEGAGEGAEVGGDPKVCGRLALGVGGDGGVGEGPVLAAPEGGVGVGGEFLRAISEVEALGEGLGPGEESW